MKEDEDGCRDFRSPPILNCFIQYLSADRDILFSLQNAFIFKGLCCQASNNLFFSRTDLLGMELEDCFGNSTFIIHQNYQYSAL